jgi:hypothetical protein
MRHGAKVKRCSSEGCKNYAQKGGVRVKHGQTSNDAAVKDVQIKLYKEECALSMGQRGNCAAVMDAQTMLKKEECALGMEQRSNDAALKDAQIVLSKEEYAGGMEQIAIHTMKLLHSDQSSIRLLQL